jgi:hypothetical protein
MAEHGATEMRVLLACSACASRVDNAHAILKHSSNFVWCHYTAAAGLVKV